MRKRILFAQVYYAHKDTLRTGILCAQRIIVRTRMTLRTSILLRTRILCAQG